MDKLVVALLLYSCLAMSSVYGAMEPQKDVNQWLYTVTRHQIHEKATHLRFYVQHVSSGLNATTIIVAQGPQSLNSSTLFGLVSVVGDLLTETPDPNSEPIGRVEGLAVFSSLDELAPLEAFNFVFSIGRFSGSTITMLGRSPLNNPLREMPIVGGTGMFRLARGFVTANTIQENSIYEFNIYVIHYYDFNTLLSM